MYVICIYIYIYIYIYYIYIYICSSPHQGLPFFLLHWLFHCKVNHLLSVIFQKNNKLRWYPQQPQRFIFTNLSEACCEAKRWKRLRWVSVSEMAALPPPFGINMTIFMKYCYNKNMCVCVRYVQRKYNYKTKGYTAQQYWIQSSSRSRNGVCCCIHKIWRIHRTSSFENWVQRSSCGKTIWSSEGLRTHSPKRSKIEITCRHFCFLLSCTNSIDFKSLCSSFALSWWDNQQKKQDRSHEPECKSCLDLK